MKSPRLLFVPLLLAALVALAAGCGGGGPSVPADAIAVVGSTPITKAQYDSLLAAVQGQDKAKGTPFPTQGSTAYTQLRQQAVAYLVQNEELRQEGLKLGVTITPKDIDAGLAKLAKQDFKGSETKLESAIKQSGLTMAQARAELAVNLLADKIHSKVVGKVTVSTAEEQKYYDQNKSQYSTPAETTRSVRHILVDSKKLALKLEKELANGASFAKLAKQYSKDTTSGQHGGVLIAVKGQLVKPFQDAAFSLKTNAISPPVHSQYGWHIIQALGPIVNRKASVTPFSKVQSQIKSQLLSQKQGTAWGNYLAQVKKDFAGKVSYQTGYAPPATTTTATIPGAPTTTG